MTYAAMKNDFRTNQNEIFKNIEDFFQALMNVRLDYKAAQKANDTKTMNEMLEKEQDLRMRYESRAKVLNEWFNQLKSQVDNKTYAQIMKELNQE